MAEAPPLGALGLRVGDRVRFRRTDGARWREAMVTGREKDGSVALRDAKGAARAMPIDRLEVRRAGPRGAARWQPVPEVAAAREQLTLWS
jgi:hypothetical protein